MYFVHAIRPWLTRPYCTCRNNDIENLVPSLTVAWGALICIFLLASGSSQSMLNSHSIAHVVMVAVFAFARLVHTVAYSHKSALFRGLSFDLGLLAGKHL